MGVVISRTEEVNFIDIFDNNRVLLLVPNYQRPYSWTEKEVEDFLQDIYSAYKNKIPYLFGSIYLAPVNSLEVLKRFMPNQVFDKYFQSLKSLEEFLNVKGRQIEPFFIVDGQQRITTFTLLLKALNLLNPLQLRGNKLFPRLLLSDLDNDFFQKLINGDNVEPQTLSQSRLKTAFEKIKAFVNSVENKEDFRIFLTNNLKVIKAEVADIKYAVMLFISQTDRGKPLSYIDRLKGLFEFYVYYKFPEKEREKYSQQIDETFEKIYILQDKLQKVKVFKDEEYFETILYRVITLLDYFDRSDELKEKYNESLDFSKLRSISLSKAYERLVNILRKSNNPKEEIDFYLRILGNFIKVLDTISENIGKNEYQRTFIIFQPTQMSYLFLTKWVSLFPNETWERKSFKWTRLYQKNSPVIDKVNREWLELQEQLKEITVFTDYLETLDNYRTNILNKLQENTLISLLDFIEKMDYAIWKPRKEPVSSFKQSWETAFNSKTTPQSAISAFNRLIAEYLNKYLFDNELTKFLLIEFEALTYKNNPIYKCEIEKAFTIEHIFPKNPDWDIEQFGFDTIDEYNEFIEKIGNKLLLRGSKNAEISNAPPCQKASQYIKVGKNDKCYPKSTIKVGHALQTLCTLTKNQPSQLFRDYIQLRDLALKFFTIDRFI
jgi:uncharacterized protein with ParB-like and HNH nuclease domain